jgi:hypothetical protein
MREREREKERERGFLRRKLRLLPSLSSQPGT